MTPNEYQNFTRTTATYPGACEGTPEALVYCVLGLTGESGEVAEKIKKVIRGSGFQGLTNMAQVEDDLIKEIGDVLWYCARLLDELGCDLATALRMNVEKLNSRKDRGVLHGSGDNR